MSQSGARERVIVLARYPVPGRVKTRLICALGAKGATKLHRLLLKRTVRCAQRVEPKVEVEVCMDGGGPQWLRPWLGEEVIFGLQSKGDLGDRMYQAIVRAFERGCTRAVLVGSDIPGLRPDILRCALDALEEVDAVLGPSLDGGYYLIGLRDPLAEPFEGIPWGTSRVLTETTGVLRRMNASFLLLEPLRDIDTPEDLPYLREFSLKEDGP